MYTLKEKIKDDNFNREIRLKKEIDVMVYELYGLSDQEIKIVEGV